MGFFAGVSNNNSVARRALLVEGGRLFFLQIDPSRPRSWLDLQTFFVWRIKKKRLTNIEDIGIFMYFVLSHFLN